MGASNGDHVLPVHLDAMIGRREETAVIRRLLQSSARLVTVTGGAGVGKSRLSVAAAEGLRRSLPGAIWYLDVGDRDDGADVAAAIAHVMKVDPGPDALGALVDEIGDHETLLLVDNADGVVDGLSAVAHTLVTACAGCKMIVTSREPLDVPAQFLVRTEPFLHTGLTATSDAVRLFVDRARAGDAYFQVDDRTLPDIVAVCEATRGVPLAIELAAAQVQFMDVAALARRMGDQLDTLESGATGRSLRSAVSDSWNRSTPRERVLWSELSVLAPGWDLELGEAVASRRIPDSGDAAAVLKQLIRRSIVHRRNVDGAVRYELLPALREYGAEHLADRPATEAFFARCVIRRLRNAEEHWFSDEQPQILQRLRGDLPNVRRAVRTAAAAGDADHAVQAAFTAWRQAWLIHGSLDELSTLLGDALQSGEASPYWAATGHALRAAVFQQTAKPGLARAELDIAVAASASAGSQDAEVTVLSAAEILETDHRKAVRILLALMAMLGDDAYRFDHVNIPERLAMRLRSLGDLDEARRAEDAIVERALVAGDRFEHSFMLTTRATATAATGDYDASERDARDALVLKRGLGNGLGVAHALELLADVAREKGDPRRGASLLGAASARWREAGALRSNYPPFFYDRATTERALTRRLGAEAFTAAFRYGSALSEDESIDFALHGIVEPARRTSTLPADATRAMVLTPRETQVAALVAGGESNRTIARALFVSIRTVETHVQNALVKLGLRSRTELAVWYSDRAAGRD
jgi:non-specific serine/threonine protein kinase